MNRPTSTVEDVRIIKTRGPWPSKSGGELNVLFALSADDLNRFLNTDNPGFTRVKEETGTDIHGLRSYSVSGIPKGAIGAAEWHETRTEFVTALSGLALWQCIDTNGNEHTFELDGKTSLIVPSGILHTYKALKDGTGLLVICNTLFPPDDPRTHDSFSPESFYEFIEGTPPSLLA